MSKNSLNLFDLKQEALFDPNLVLQGEWGEEIGEGGREIGEGGGKIGEGGVEIA